MYEYKEETELTEEEYVYAFLRLANGKKIMPDTAGNGQMLNNKK